MNRNAPIATRKSPILRRDSRVLCENFGWDGAISVLDLGATTPFFEELLKEFLEQKKGIFTKETYDEANHNCFDFIIQLLNFIDYDEYTKEEFVDEFIKKRVETTLRYFILAARAPRSVDLSTMADCFEHTDDVDADRAADMRSFQSSQFDIFTHDYREYSDQLEAEKPKGECSNCGCGKENDDCGPGSKEKKELVNLHRKLGKVHKILLTRRNDSMEINNELLDQFETVHRDLSSYLRGDKSEFTPTTVDLPDFDRDDMELLLGEAPGLPSMMEVLKGAQQSDAQRLTELMFMGDLLLTEYQHICHGI
ncbi:unnamed protein product, partial [Mesorhabditis spiculigera]